MLIKSATRVAEDYANQKGYTILHLDFMSNPDQSRIWVDDKTGNTDASEIVCYQQMEYNYMIYCYDSNGNQIDGISVSNALANGGRQQLKNNTNLNKKP